MLRRLLSTSALIGFCYALNTGLGLFRARLIAQTYGFNPALDVFNAANNIPDLLFAVISGGALALAFIPVLTATLQNKGREALWQLFSRVANIAVVVTSVIALFVALFAEILVQRVVVPGFAVEQQTLVVELMRLNLIALLIFSVSGLVMGALQAQQHFLLPALAPLCYNAGQIFGVLVLGARFGIHGLVYGVILGAALHLAIQLPGLVRYGFRYTPQFNLNDPAVRHVLHLMSPRIRTIFYIQMIFVVNDNLASGLGKGAVSALTLGWGLLQIPETILGTATGTALLPTLSELAARRDMPALRQLLRRALFIMGALAFLATLVSLIAIEPAVRLVFEGRSFTPEDADKLILVTRLFLLGLTAHCLKEITARAFYALQDAVTPRLTAAANLLLFMMCGLALTPIFGFAALAFANSLAFTVETVLMIFILYQRKWL